MAKTRTLVVKILSDNKSLSKAANSSFADLKKVEKGSRRTNKAFKALKVGALAAGAAIGAGLAASAKIGIDKLIEDERVMKETEARLKSTKKAAGVTAKEIDKLAQSIEAQSGISNAAIQKGENLLLTFTNIKNGVGKTDKVFNQATRTMVDMSVAMGTDMKTNAILVGKALNDPVKGVAALNRVGVQFTEKQKKVIKRLTESGRAMDAQKVILKELNTQFGGTAKAFGDSTEGKIEKVKRQFEALAATTFRGLLPAISGLMDFMLNRGIPALSRFSAWVERTAKRWQPRMERAFKAVQAAARVAMVWLEKNVVPVIREFTATAESLMKNFMKFWNKWGDDIISVTKGVMKVLGPVILLPLKQIVAAVRLIMAVLRGDWSTAWKQLKALAVNPIKALKASLTAILRNLIPAVAAAAKNVGLEVGRKILGGIRESPIGQIPSFIKSRTVDPIAGFIGRAKDQAFKMGRALMEGMGEGLKRFGKSQINGLIVLVRSVIGVVNKLPFVDIPKPAFLAEGTARTAGPTFAMIGEDGPEAVIPLGAKRRRRGLKLWAQAAHQMGVPGFADGGIIGRAVSGAFNSGRSAAGNALSHLPGLGALDPRKLLGQLPDLPRFQNDKGLLSGMGKHILEQARGFITEMFGRLRRSIFGGGTGGQGSVGGLAPSAAAGLSAIRRIFGGVTLTSGFRSAADNARVGGAKNSDHLTGRAIDLVPSAGWTQAGIALLDRVAAWAAGQQSVRWVGWRGVAGHGPFDHLHISFLKNGGIFGPGRIPSYETGTPFVPETGPAMLHRGERVVPADENGMSGPLVVIEHMTVQDAADVDLLGATFSQALTLRGVR